MAWLGLGIFVYCRRAIKGAVAAASADESGVAESENLRIERKFEILETGRQKILVKYKRHQKTDLS